MPNATTPPTTTQPSARHPWQVALNHHLGHRCYIVDNTTLRCVDCEQTLDLATPQEASTSDAEAEPCALFWCDEAPHGRDVDGAAFHRSAPMELAAGMTATITGLSEEDRSLVELAMEIQADGDRQIPLGTARAAGAALVALADRIEIGTGRG